MKVKTDKASKVKDNAKYLNFTLYNNDSEVKFATLSEFTTKTGISSFVAKDLLDGNTPYYKLWTKDPK